METERQKIEISVTKVGGLRGRVDVFINGRLEDSMIVPEDILDEVQKFAEFVQDTINNS